MALGLEAWVRELVGQMMIEIDVWLVETALESGCASGVKIGHPTMLSISH
jgi:hypothetical protein